MTTHELAHLLLQLPDVTLYVNDEPVTAPDLEEVVLFSGERAVIFWTKE